MIPSTSSENNMVAHFFAVSKRSSKGSFVDTVKGMDGCTVLCIVSIFITLGVVYHLNNAIRGEMNKNASSAVVMRLKNIRMVLYILLILQFVALYFKLMK